MRVLFFFGFLLVLKGLEAQTTTGESFKQVNSFYDELNPVLSPDGTTLFFTIGNHPDNIGGKRDPGDIWIAKWMGASWSAPIHAGPVLNDRSYNAVAGMSEDGNKLYLLSHYDASGNSARTQGISVSKNSGSGWSAPQNIFIPYFQNKSSFQSGWLSADQRVFVYSAEAYGTLGVEDIYVSINENGKWSEPINLGEKINTKFQELCPWLSEDGKTLYFSSNGRKGAGSFDIFSAKRLDDSWINWSDAVNAGPSINSEGRELFFRDFKQLGFSMYTSTKNSDGYGDIKMYRYSDPILTPIDTNVVAKNQPEPVSQNQLLAHAGRDSVKIIQVVDPGAKTNVVRVYGTVTSIKTGEPVEATISFAGPPLQEQPVTTSSANGYAVDIPSAEVYTIRIEAPGYVSTLEKLDIHTIEMDKLEMNFKLQPVEVGTTVNLKNVLFVQTKTELLPESYDELDMVVSFLKTNPNVKIELSGHTDNRGVHADNVRLSQQRVNTVKSYLVSKGIDSKRISGKGYGGTKPIASNDTEDTRKMNRRVEFTIRKF